MPAVGFSDEIWAGGEDEECRRRLCALCDVMYPDIASSPAGRKPAGGLLDPSIQSGSGNPRMGPVPYAGSLFKRGVGPRTLGSHIQTQSIQTPQLLNRGFTFLFEGCGRLTACAATCISWALAKSKFSPIP